MGDRTWGGFVVYGATSHQLESASDVLEEVFGEPPADTEPDLWSDGWPLRNGHWLTDGEVNCGWVDEYAGKLQNIFRGATWWAREDPAYEWLGDCALGRRNGQVFSGNCDSDGQVVVSWQQLTWAKPTGATLAQVFGRPFFAELEAARRLYLMQPPMLNDDVQVNADEAFAARTGLDRRFVGLYRGEGTGMALVRTNRWVDGKRERLDVTVDPAWVRRN